jgi:hypothetical protein
MAGRLASLVAVFIDPGDQETDPQIIGIQTFGYLFGALLAQPVAEPADHPGFSAALTRALIMRSIRSLTPRFTMNSPIRY